MFSHLNILITGGAGFIGSHLSNQLRARGHSVRVLDCLSPQIHTSSPHLSPTFTSLVDDIEFIRGDINNRQILRHALKNIDVVIHLAAETGTGQSMYSINSYCGTNIQGTAQLLDLISTECHSVKSIVVASSRAVLGEGAYLCPQHGKVFPETRDLKYLEKGIFDPLCPQCRQPMMSIPTSEDSPTCPTSIYGITKLAQERLVLTTTLGLGITGIALRFQNVYGPGQSLHNPYTGILSIFSTRFRNNDDINIFEDGKESRDFVFIDDVVLATTLAAEYPHITNSIFNVGSGLACSVLHVAELLASNLKSSSRLNISGNFRVGDIRHNTADLSRSRSILGYQPRISIETGLRLFSDWVLTQELPTDNYNASLKELTERGLLK